METINAHQELIVVIICLGIMFAGCYMWMRALKSAVPMGANGNWENSQKFKGGGKGKFGGGNSKKGGGGGKRKNRGKKDMGFKGHQPNPSFGKGQPSREDPFAMSDDEFMKMLGRRL